MKRYYCEMYSKRTFLGNIDCDSLEECLSYLIDYDDKLLIKDTYSDIVYSVKKTKEMG